jgi:hypothetical protein
MLVEEFRDEYESALREYSKAMEDVHDYLGDPKPIVDNKIRIINEEEGRLYQLSIKAREKYVEARNKYFNLQSPTK